MNTMTQVAACQVPWCDGAHLTEQPHWRWLGRASAALSDLEEDDPAADEAVPALWLYLRQDGETGPPRVCLDTRDNRPWQLLVTAVEAEQLGRSLLAAAALLRAGGG